MSELTRIIEIGQRHSIKEGEYYVTLIGLRLFDLLVKLGFMRDINREVSWCDRFWWWKRQIGRIKAPTQETEG